MALNPNSLKNLKKGVKFSSRDSRIKKGRTPGMKTRKATFEELLDIKTECIDPKGKTVKLPLADQVALSMIRQAIMGSVSAASFVFDSAYGKILPDDYTLPIEPEKPSIDWSRYTDEELLQLTALMEKGKV